MRRLFQHLQKQIDLAARHLQHRLLRRCEGIGEEKVKPRRGIRYLGRRVAVWRQRWVGEEPGAVDHDFARAPTDVLEVVATRCIRQPDGAGGCVVVGMRGSADFVLQ